MMRILTVSLALALSGCISLGLFPTGSEEHQKDWIGSVYFAERHEDACLRMAEDVVPPRVLVEAEIVNIGGCYVADVETMVLPNPCTWPQWDAYARLVCHEMGHANGWTHGDPPG